MRESVREQEGGREGVSEKERGRERKRGFRGPVVEGARDVVLVYACRLCVHARRRRQWGTLRRRVVGGSETWTKARRMLREREYC